MAAGLKRAAWRGRRHLPRRTAPFAAWEVAQIRRGAGTGPRQTRSGRYAG